MIETSFYVKEKWQWQEDLAILILLISSGIITDFPG